MQSILFYTGCHVHHSQPGHQHGGWQKIKNPADHCQSLVRPESNTLSMSTNTEKFVTLLGHQGGERNACEVLGPGPLTQEAQNCLPNWSTSTTSSQQTPRCSLFLLRCHVDKEGCSSTTEALTMFEAFWEQRGSASGGKWP